MKRKLFVLSFALLSVLAGVVYFVYSCREGGNVRNVQRSMEESDRYTRQDISSAMDIVENKFKVDYPGCELTDLWYDDADSKEQETEWAEQYEADEAIVLLSNFKVGASGGDGSLNPNETYENWQWILVRQEGGSWSLKTWGY